MTTPDLAFCEPRGATVYSREHIRVVGPEGRMYGGGIPSAAICGNDRLGWDIEGDVTTESIADHAKSVIGRLCDPCHRLGLELLVRKPTTDPRAHPEQNPETCTVCGDGVEFHDAEAVVACGLMKETK